MGDLPEPNRYQSPRAKSGVGETARTKPPTKPPAWVRASGYLCLGLCLLGILAYSFTAGMLLPQAGRLEAEFQSIPTNAQSAGTQQFRTEIRAAIQMSWTLGMVSVALVLTTLAAAILAMQQKYRYGWALLLIGFGVYLVLAIALRPT
ncbi:MAG: hypothetical protein MK108_13375 [Mariniblastus sp.]|nr:hypothetical protein [Mariniblastus sp.]